MANELATTNAKAVAFEQTDENIQLLKNTLSSAKTILTDPELRLFLYQAKRSGLDPLARQIYVMKTGEKVTFMTSIDGQRLIAQRTGEYEGQVGPQWCGKDGIWKDVWLENEPPAAAKVGVWRKGFKDAVYGVATWKSYAKYVDEWSNGKKTGNRVLSGTWLQLSDVMIAKCAEAIAFRKAFPQELADLYVAEEMNQAQPEPVHEAAQTEAVEETGTIMIKDNQRKRLHATLDNMGIMKNDQKSVVYGLAKELFNVTIISGNQLTQDQAQVLIEHLENMDVETLGAFLERAGAV